MRSIIWVDGRLSWPLVVVVTYLAAVILLFDLSWRLVTIPFDALVVYAFAIAGLVAVVIGLMIRRNIRRARTMRA